MRISNTTRLSVLLAVSIMVNVMMFVGCGSPNPTPKPSPGPKSALQHFAHRAHATIAYWQQTAGKQLSEAEEEGIVHAQAPANTATASFEGKCRSLPNLTTEVVLEGMGRDNGDYACESSFSSNTTFGQPVPSDGTLQGLHIFGRNPAFAASGTIHIFVITKGGNTETDTGLTAALGIGTGLVTADDTLHTFAVHKGDQLTAHTTAQMGDTLTNLSVLVDVQ